MIEVARPVIGSREKEGERAKERKRESKRERERESERENTAEVSRTLQGHGNPVRNLSSYLKPGGVIRLHQRTGGLQSLPMLS